ncbi:MAG: CoA transferase [Gammaproteobacteria bacterium]|nr:CoA transferase [Gammaproteobacteria bacterium]
MTDSRPRMFDGLKVVDAGSWVAGPVAATILADYGAQVIKIEMPTGDPFRRLAQGPGTPDADIDYAWAQDARNKRSIALNLKTPQGIEVLKKLVAECDIYVTNYPLAMRRKLGLTYEELKPLNQRMIYASLTAYGEQGPEKDREGFDLIAYWSRTGLMDLVRQADAKPALSIPGMGDHPTAVALYAAIVSALYQRERTGEGSLVHTSLIANGTWAASCIAAAKFADGSDFSNYPSLTAKYFTRELYQTRDHRWLQFTMVRTPEEISTFFRVLDASYLLDEPQFQTTRGRIESGAALANAIQPILAQRDANEWIAEFKAAGVPVSMVGSIHDLPDDPQLIANGILREPDEAIGSDYVINHPVNVEASGRAPIKRAPDVGEHSDAILMELGYEQADIDRFRASDVIA